MKRTDIERKDVFLSWTGKDRELKNKIKDYLESHCITCLESDEGCSGDFRQWSREAVSACNVFLLILTENTLNSEYVPVEIEEYKKLSDFENRIVPVATSLNLYSREPWGISAYASAVFTEGDEETWLSSVLHKTESLIINHLDGVYTKATEPDYLKLIPLYRTKNIKDGQYDRSFLYIPRSLTEDDGTVCSSPDGFINDNGIVFISGPAGSGKTSYIDEIRYAASEDTVVLSLPCYKIARNRASLAELMYEEFARLCGNRCFYTAEDFYRLISLRRLVLILDGMDEVATESGTRRLLTKVEDYYLSSDNVCLIFTSRNPEDADVITMKGKAPRRFTLDKLTDEQIRALSSNLFVLFGSGEKNEDFYISIKDLNDEIKTNPLLLSQLALVYEDSGKIPETVVGIYDAVSEMTLRLDTTKEITEIPDAYSDMLRNLGSILKTFAKERYLLLSQGRSMDAVKIFSKILKDKYGEESRERAEFLVDYLQNRAIMSEGEFYHKMFLEYFTAVYYYEHTFDDYDELENTDLLRELFSHYTDPYWSTVIKMYLVKTDSLMDGEMTETLYSTVLSFGISDYTILFDTCRDLIRHKTEAETVIITQIIKSSATGVYSPYGVMFWYASEYDLAESMLLALVRMKGEEYFPKALALVRDAIFLFTEKFTVADITDKVGGAELFDAASAGLMGVRRGLCELFCLGTTDCTEGDDIYPRCFNIREARAFMETGSGIRGTMTAPFNDELGLYSHTEIPEHNGEFVGIAAAVHDTKEIERVLNSKPTTKLCGLFLSPSDKTDVGYMAFDRSSVKVMYIPEGSLFVFERDYSYKGSMYIRDCTLHMPLSQHISFSLSGTKYVRSRLRITDKVIDDGEFKYCDSLTEVIIEEGTEQIYGRAFYGCKNLERVSLADSVMEIGSEAFRNCEKLVAVKLPNEITEISMGAFNNCASLKTIEMPDSVKAVRGGAFRNCKNLAAVRFSENLNTVEAGAFRGCSSLKRIVFPKSVKELLNSAFSECDSLEEVILPEDIEEIGYYVFAKCQSLKAVTLPIKYKGELRNLGIGEGVRVTFTDLDNTELDEVSSVDFDSEEIAVLPSQFAFCKGLKRVTIPDHIRHIGSNAFRGCEKLREVILPQTLEQIGANAFLDCVSLEALEILGVNMIGKDAFKGCYSLKRLTLPASFKDKLQYLGLGDCVDVVFVGEDREFRPNIGITGIAPYEYQYSRAVGIVIIPEGVKEIGISAFEASSVTTAVFPEGLIEIGSKAFNECADLKIVDFSKTVTCINDRAFSGCGIQKLNIPDSVTRIDEAAFANCHNLTSVTLGNGVTWIAESLFHNCETLSEVSLPDGITEIRRYAFCSGKSLSRITLPSSLCKIEKGAFAFCENLLEIIVPEGVTELGMGTFRMCKSLTKAILPNGLSEISDNLFDGCESLTEINIPNDVSFVGNSSFCDCRSLKFVSVPDKVIQIGSNSFKNCTKLENIALGGVKEIKFGAFVNCKELKYIDIPSSVLAIDDSAFENCSSLETIELGHGLRKIGDNAFAGCTGLKKVRLSSNFKKDVSRIFGEIAPDIIEWI